MGNFIKLKKKFYYDEKKRMKRLEKMENSKQMLINKVDSMICFTTMSEIAYSCTDEIQEDDYFNIVFKNNKIEILETLYKKLKNKEIHVLILSAKFQFILFNFKIVNLFSAFQYNSFKNACTINNQIQNLVYRNITPHINLFYFGNYISSKDIIKLTKIKKLNENVYGLQVLEYGGSTTIKQYIEEQLLFPNKRKFNQFIISFLFQILYTLHCIYLYFPSFRHNDLHLDNILKDKSKTCYYEPFPGIFYKLAGFIKLIDFGWSSMNSVKHLGLNMSPNHYVDINKLFNHLILLLEPHSTLLNQNVWKFIQDVVPTRYRVGFKKSNKKLESEFFMSIWNPHSEYMITDDKRWILSSSLEKGERLVNFTSPSNLLKDSIFDIFKTTQVDVNNLFSCQL